MTGSSPHLDLFASAIPLRLSLLYRFEILLNILSCLDTDHFLLSSSRSASALRRSRSKGQRCQEAQTHKHRLLRPTPLSPASSSSAQRFTNDDDDSANDVNLSAYHPDLCPSEHSPASLAQYRSLLPHCLVHPSTFPPNMRKYWRHRFSLFSLYSSGCLLDEQSWYSVTPESVAFRIAKRCATDKTVVDLFAGQGAMRYNLQ